MGNEVSFSWVNEHPMAMWGVCFDLRDMAWPQNMEGMVRSAKPKLDKCHPASWDAPPVFFQGLFRQETLWNTGLCQWFGISLQLIYLYKVPGICGLLTRYHHVTLIIQLSVQDTHMPIPTWLSRRVTLDVRFLVAGTLGMVLGCLGDPCYQ
jgi:hypothetical protein